MKQKKSKLLRYIRSYLPFWRGKKIGFYSNFGHGDLGDDASLIVVRALLGEDILPISKRCYVFNPHMLRALLIGGGCVLNWDSPYIPRRILSKNKWPFPVILFSAGLDCDYEKTFTEEAKEKIKRLCSICDYVTVRDKISKEFINSLGVGHVGLLPHLELALEERPKSPANNKEGFTVGIVLTPRYGFSPLNFEKIIDVFSKFTDYLTGMDRNVIYISFEKKSSENKKEAEVIREITKRLKGNKDKVKVLDDSGPQETLFTIKNYCDIMVCMRLHSAVFSVNAGVPFINISYNLMHKGFLEMLDAEDLDISFFSNFSFDTLSDKFEYVLRHHSKIKSKLGVTRDSLRETIYKEVAYIKDIFLLSSK